MTPLIAIYYVLNAHAILEEEYSMENDNISKCRVNTEEEEEECAHEVNSNCHVGEIHALKTTLFGTHMSKNVCGSKLQRFNTLNLNKKLMSLL